MADEHAVLFANDAFYLAFANRDADAMDALWARATPVACIHPGWEALTGRDRVMESWRAILGGANPPRIACREAKVVVRGEFALVVCYETFRDAALVATNVFVREDGSWKMIHHQAGPTAHRPEGAPAPAGVVH